MANSKISVRNLCYIGVFTALMVACAPIAIPLPGGVPITLQTWVISLAGIVLGAKNGTISTLMYVLLGAVGVPVFAHFTGGIGIVFGPTGGFILSFPIMALLAGIGESKNNVVWLVCGLTVGTIINFISGMIYFSWVMPAPLQAAFYATVFPFIPTAILRIILLPVISKSIKVALAKTRVIS